MIVNKLENLFYKYQDVIAGVLMSLLVILALVLYSFDIRNKHRARRNISTLAQEIRTDESQPPPLSEPHPFGHNIYYFPDNGVQFFMALSKFMDNHPNLEIVAVMQNIGENSSHMGSGVIFKEIAPRSNSIAQAK